MTRFAGDNINMSTYMGSGADFGELANAGQAANSYLKQQAYKASAEVAKAGMQGFSAAMSGKYEADAIEAAGKAKADATRSNGMWDMIGSIGGGVLGGIGKMGGGGGGGPSFADGMNSGLPSFGDYSGIPSGGWGIPFK